MIGVGYKRHQFSAHSDSRGESAEEVDRRDQRAREELDNSGVPQQPTIQVNRNRQKKHLKHQTGV